MSKAREPMLMLLAVTPCLCDSVTQAGMIPLLLPAVRWPNLAAHIQIQASKRI
jgi:hypothetical protein